MIGANHKQAIVTVVERKSGYEVIDKVENKMADLVGAAIVDRLKPFGKKSKRLRLITAKSSADTARLTKRWAEQVTLQGHLLVGNWVVTRSSMSNCANTCLRSGRWNQ